MDADFVTLGDLVAATSSAGRPMKSQGLKRLRREGLLPQGLQKYPLGSQGSESRYPAWARDQLIDLIDLQRRRRQRPFEVVRFIAWEEGLWIDLNALRATLSKLIGESVSVVQHLGPAGQADDTLAKRIVASPFNNAGRHPMVVGMLGEGASEDSVRDVAFNIGQIAARTEDSDLAKDRFNEATARLVPEEMRARGGTTSVFDSFELPPVGKWPRIISRVNRTQMEVGRQLLSLLRTHPELVSDASSFESDSISAIRLRAAMAAPWIVAAKVNPSTLDRFAL